MAVGPSRSARKITARRITSLAKSVTYGLSRTKTLALWRNIIDRFPSEVSYARQYVMELLLSEGWVDLDSFARKARRYKSADLDLNYIDAALARLELESARSQLDDYARRHPSVDQRHLVLREYAYSFLLGDFATAGSIARSLRPRGTRWDGPALQLARGADFSGKIEKRWQAAKPKRRDYDIFAINLDSDTLRMERVKKQLDGIDYVRVPGVKGAYLPNYVLGAVSHNEGTQLKGTMGCFMSHVMVWEKVVASGRNALVLEDDASVIVGLPPRLSGLKVPDDFDLVFVNERMEPTDFAYPPASFYTMPTSAVAMTKPPDWSSAGTDGYFISPKGAALLLSLVQRDGIAGDVDWRLISYSLTKPERARIISRGGFAGRALAYHERFRTSSKRLRCHVLLPALVRQFAGGSVRLWDNELQHAHMAAVSDLLTKRRLPTR